MLRYLCILLMYVLFPLQSSAKNNPGLLGNWDGARSFMEDRGITAGVALTVDSLYNINGGVDQEGTVLTNLDLTMEIDTGKIGLWDNGRFFFYGLGNSNSTKFLTEIVGDIQATSNIEAEESFKLYEAWYEHLFFQESVSLLVGLHDYNSEFDVLEYAGLFINSSFGISPDISQVGPSIFPLTALAMRLKVEPNENAYLMAAVYDGVPGDPDHPTRTSIRLDDGDGVFAALEAGITMDDPGQSNYSKIAVGGWMHTSQTENFESREDNGNKGVYVIGEKNLFAENNAGQGLGAFLQLGMADEDRNQISIYWGAGLHYTGLIPGREGDVTGLAVASARNGSQFMEYFNKIEGDNLNHTETAIELTYRAEISPWFIIQPNVQYIMNPGMEPSLDNALVGGLRMEITF